MPLMRGVPLNHFQTHPFAYVGSDEFETVRFWIDGFDAACSFTFPDEISDLKGFREWLLTRFGGSSNIPWHSLFVELFGGGPDSLAKFFDLFWEFRGDVKARGLKTILKDHVEYEYYRYGFIASSKYYLENWHKTICIAAKPLVKAT